MRTIARLEFSGHKVTIARLEYSVDTVKVRTIARLEYSVDTR